MPVYIDHGRCQSSGLCEALAPAVFRLGDGGVELVDGADPAGHADDVAAAIDSCPMEALRRAGPGEHG